LHASKLVVICVVLLLIVLFYVLCVCKCVLYYCHRVTSQLKLTNISDNTQSGTLITPLNKPNNEKWTEKYYVRNWYRLVRVLDYTAVAMKCIVFLNVTPCSLEDKCEDLEERAICIMTREEQASLLLSRYRLEIFRKLDAQLSNCVTSHTKQ
jgi:hypothetical protein